MMPEVLPVRLVAFHGLQSEKDAILAQLRAHAAADEIIHGVYWENGKGCAVGCQIHSGDHAEYEPRFGIPQALAHLEDAIFEGMKNGDSKTWPIRFMEAIPIGADLSLVQWQFLHRILTDETITPGINHPLVKDAVAEVARLLHAWGKGDPIDESAAESAAETAEAAAGSAAAEAAESARLAAGSARWAAGSAWSARLAACAAAAEAAESARLAARSAAGSARSASESAAAYHSMSQVLLDLLAAAPVVAGV